jgi:hypothetical protein
MMKNLNKLLSDRRGVMVIFGACFKLLVALMFAVGLVAWVASANTISGATPGGLTYRPDGGVAGYVPGAPEVGLFSIPESGCNNGSASVVYVRAANLGLNSLRTINTLSGSYDLRCSRGASVSRAYSETGLRGSIAPASWGHSPNTSRYFSPAHGLAACEHVDYCRGGSRPWASRFGDLFLSSEQGKPMDLRISALPISARAGPVLLISLTHFAQKMVNICQSR